MWPTHFGGFEGNAQSFRILTRLAMRAIDEPGLNLTRQTLNGTLKYPWPRDVEDVVRSRKWGAYESDRDYYDWVRAGSEPHVPSLEARIMDWADDVTYAVHDMDDFYRASLIPLERLSEGGDELAAFQAYLRMKETDRADTIVNAAARVFAAYPVRTQYEGRLEERANLRALGSFLITRYIDAFQ